jgi:MYXO-CTERM domain-containing protein
MTDDSVGSQSWCYVNGLSYYSDAQFIGSFVDRISKGGNMILNMSPMPDGSFPQRQKDILAAFGKFLRQMGTAIYNTRTFAVYGEGPTKMGGGEFTSPTALKSDDIRYTKSKDGDAVYAILGGWPGNGQVVNMTAVTTSRFALGSGKVFLFGPTGDGTGEIALQATQDSSGLHVTLPSTSPYTALAYAIKISKSGTPPEKTPWLSGGSNTDGGVSSTGGGSGSPDASPAGTGGGTGAGGRNGAGGAGGAFVGRGGANGTGGVGAGGTGVVGTGAGGAGTGGAATGGRIGAGGASVPGSSGSGGASATSGGAGNVGGTVSMGGNGAGGAEVGAGGVGQAVGGHGGSASGETITKQVSSSSGCSCATQGNARSNAGGVLLVGLAVASLLCRRRRHR